MGTEANSDKSTGFASINSRNIAEDLVPAIILITKSNPRNRIASLIVLLHISRRRSKEILRSIGKSLTDLISREEANIWSKGLIITLGGLKSTELDRKSTGNSIGIDIILCTMINNTLIETPGHGSIGKENSMFPKSLFIN